MKSLIILLSLYACAHTQPPQRVQSSEYMSKDQIIYALENPQVNIESGSGLKLRKDSLIPLEDMLKNKPKTYKSKIIKSGELKSEVDLRGYDTPVQNQGVEGLCTAFAITAGMENLGCSKYEKCFKLSERHMWSKYQQYSTHSAFKAGVRHYIAPLKYWPYNSGPKPGLKDAGIAKVRKAPYLDEDINAMKYYLSNNIPVNLAMRVPEDMMYCKKVISPYSSYTNGGHAISLVGYFEDPKYGTIVILKNSWGPSCGDKGYQYMPISIIKKSGFYGYMYAVSELDVKDSPKPSPEPSPEPEPINHRDCMYWYRQYKPECSNVGLMDELLEGELKCWECKKWR